MRLKGSILLMVLAPGAAFADASYCEVPRPGVLSSQATACHQDALRAVHEYETVALGPLVEEFKAKGFRCQRPSQKSGLTCFGKLPTYPKPVAIVIPPHYRPPAKAKTILFLHGNNFGRESLETQNKRSGWGSMLADTGRNEIMVVPLSYGKTEDFEKSLATPEAFGPFNQSVADLLESTGLSKTNKLGSITLAGHSGAYRPLAKIAAGGWLGDKINEIALFDSAYGRAPEFAHWASQKGHRLWSAYNPSDGDLNGTNRAIMEELQAQGKGYFKAEGHQVSSEKVLTNSVGFVPTNGDHFGAIPTYFRAFLNINTK